VNESSIKILINNQDKHAQEVASELTAAVGPANAVVTWRQCQIAKSNKICSLKKKRFQESFKQSTKKSSSRLEHINNTSVYYIQQHDKTPTQTSLLHSADTLHDIKMW